MRRVYRRIAPENVKVRPLAGSNMLRMQGTTFDFWIFQMCRARRTDTSLMVASACLPAETGIFILSITVYSSEIGTVP
jgi:hypothetical protein